MASFVECPAEPAHPRPGEGRISPLYGMNCHQIGSYGEERLSLGTESECARRRVAEFRDAAHTQTGGRSAQRGTAAEDGLAKFNGARWPLLSYCSSIT